MLLLVQLVFIVLREFRMIADKFTVKIEKIFKNFVKNKKHRNDIFWKRHSQQHC